MDTSQTPLNSPTPQGGETPMEQSILDWQNWLLAAGRSRTTVSAYSWDVHALAKRYPTLTPFDYKLSDLNRYQAERRLADVGDSARKRSVSAARSFFGYVCGKSKSPARTLPVPRVKVLKHIPRTLTWDQVGAVLATCETTQARGLRNLALICLLMESALRNAEVCRLEMAKVDLAGHRLRVVTKGGREQSGSFDGLTAEYLAAWIIARADFAQSTTKTLFCSVGGLTPGAPLTPEGLRGIFRKIGAAAGLADGFSPHDLRRSCATLKTQLGAPTRTIQVGGRWSNLREVETYTRSISLDDFEKFSIVGHVLGSNVKPPV